MEKEKTCPHCRAAFNVRRADKSYCSERCQSAAARKRRTAKTASERRTVECPNCSLSFVQSRSDKKFCSASCGMRFSQRKQSCKDGDTTADALTLRLFSDGFYLGDLPQEIEHIRKSPRIVASLESQLANAIADDAIWPIGLPGRIAITLVLLKTPSTLKSAKWRHPHQQRRGKGSHYKPTRTLIHTRIGRAGVI
jgi:hypothetical protein